MCVCEFLFHRPWVSVAETGVQLMALSHQPERESLLEVACEHTYTTLKSHGEQRSHDFAGVFYHTEGVLPTQFFLIPKPKKDINI